MDRHPFDIIDSLDELVRVGEPISFCNATPLSPQGRIITGGSVEVQPFVTFDGPIFLGDGVRIGPYSMLRGPLYIGAGSKIGPYCEVTRSFVGKGSVIAHKNIIPDTVIYDNVWISGGVIVCNVRLDKRSVRLPWGDELRHRDAFGAVIEDDARLGVNVILMPGTVIKRGVHVLGPSSVSGVVS